MRNICMQLQMNTRKEALQQVNAMSRSNMPVWFHPNVNLYLLIANQTAIEKSHLKKTLSNR